MKSMLKKTFFPIVILLLVYFCAKVPEEPEYIVIEYPDSQMSISLSDTTDTLLVKGTISIDMKVNAGNQILTSTDIYIENNQLYKNYNKTNFSFNSTKYTDGIYHLIFYTHSELRPDSVRQYYIYFSDTLEIPIIIDNIPPVPSPISIISIEPKNGKMELSWKKYPGKGFKSYQIFIYDYKNPYVTIINVNDTTWRDPDYVGGVKDYYIRINAYDYHINGPKRSVDYPLPSVHVNNIVNQKLIVSWDKCIFDSVFSKYELYMKYDDYYAEWNWIATFSQVEDTTYTNSNFIFGNSLIYKVFVSSPYNTYGNGNTSSGYFGKKIPGFTEVRYNETNNLIYLIGDRSYVFNANSMELVNSILGNLTVSLDGSKLFERTGATMHARLDAYFNKVEEFDLSDIVEDEIASAYNLIGSDNEKAVFISLTYSSPTYYYYKTFLVDLDAKTVLAYNSRSPYIFNFSHDLNSFTYKDELYTYSPEQSVLEVSYLEDYDRFCFLPDREGYVYTTDNSVRIYNKTGLESQFPTEMSLFKPTIDSKNNLIGGYANESGSKWYLVYNLSNGDQLAKINVITGQTSPPKYLWLADKKIFHIQGFYWPID